MFIAAIEVLIKIKQIGKIKIAHIIIKVISLTFLLKSKSINVYIFHSQLNKKAFLSTK